MTSQVKGFKKKTEATISNHSVIEDTPVGCSVVQRTRTNIQRAVCSHTKHSCIRYTKGAE